MLWNKKRNLIIYGVLQLLAMIGCVLFQHINDIASIWMVNLFYLFLLTDYIGVLFFLIRHYERKEELSINHWCMMAVAAFVGMFLLFFLGMEDTIKQYDATVYWIKSINVSDSMYADLLNGLRDIKQTLSAEYGDLPVLLLAPFIHYFGRNNIAFCSLVYVVYGIPAFSLFVLYTVRVIKKCGIQNKCTNILIDLFFLCPSLLLPILAGYVDMIGIVWIGVLLNVSLDWNYASVTISKDVVFILVSVALLLSRRWYAFYIVGFYFSFAVEEVVFQLQQKKRNPRRMLMLMMNMALIAGVSSFLIWILNKDVFRVFFGGNYTEAYAAYKIRPTYMDFVKGIGNLGGIFFAFAVIGIVRLCVQKKTLTYVVKITMPPVSACILFGTVQSMGTHHMYLLIPHLVILAGIGICTFFGYVKHKRFIYLTLASILILNLWICFSPILTSVHTKLLSDIRTYPHKMQNAAVIKEASRYLSELEGTVYICGEGNDVSSELLNRCFLPDLESALPNMISSSIVDTRDGFPSQAFLADYIVIRNPYETNFPQEQQITRQIWDMLVHSELGRKYYALDKQYALSLDHTYIEIYKKTGSLHPELIEYVSDNIAQFYGCKEDKKFTYMPNWFHALANYQTGSNISYYPWDASIYVAGNGNSMNAAFELDGKFKEMNFSLGSFEEGDVLRIYEEGELMREEELSWENLNFTIDLSNRNSMQLSITGNGKESFGYHILNPSIR